MPPKLVKIPTAVFNNDAIKSKISSIFEDGSSKGGKANGSGLKANSNADVASTIMLPPDLMNSDVDPLDDKDEYGATKALREAINQKYQIVEIIGQGSYGCVSKGVCKTTGRTVALKIMIN